MYIYKFVPLVQFSGELLKENILVLIKTVHKTYSKLLQKRYYNVGGRLGLTPVTTKRNGNI
jgi:hypothetical protein